MSTRRRWPFVLGAALSVVAATGAWFWFVGLRTHRPSLHAGERYGIDVSGHQGRIEWTKVAGDDIKFAYIKATEGGDFVDDHFAENWAAAKTSGIERGAYHFFTLCTPGQVQADNFLQIVGDQDGALAPAVDLELLGNCSQRPDGVAVYRELTVLLDAVEARTHKHTVLYVGDDFEERYLVKASYGRPLWIRRLLQRPDENDWTIWQANGLARVEGVSGDVDLDVMRLQ